MSAVLLGLRNNVLECGLSPAEFVFGTSLRIPGEFVLPYDFSPNPQIFLEEFREHMREVRPIPVEHKHKRKIFVYKELSKCSHVFLRVLARKSLESPYSGPHRVLSRPSDRVFEIDVNGSARNVSVENIKPAFFARDMEVENRGSPPTLLNDSLNGHSDPLPDSSSRDLSVNNQPNLRTYSRKKKVTFAT